jgi:hypothetical protein
MSLRQCKSLSKFVNWFPLHNIVIGNTAQGKETEHNWAARERAIQLVRGMLKGDVHNRYFEHFLNSLKDGFLQCSLKTVIFLQSYFHSNIYFPLAGKFAYDSGCEYMPAIH